MPAGKYKNPVYYRSFPDPFVLRFAGRFYAFSTGRSADGRVFSVLESDDLVNWREQPGAMQPLDDDYPHYWAPEVIYSNGRFYLYYSVGNETLMEIRVAISDRPGGGYTDLGKRLTSEDFAIDPHVFRDSDGSWYMFYATDFLEHTHIGTGTVVDAMVDPLTLEGNPRPVTRAKYDWQVYDPQRKEKGNVRWHTVEGPFVLNRKGLYYQMFSGGNWQNVSYGVSFAVSDRITADDEWEQFADGTAVLPILRTIPDKVAGPGHNSVVNGPNGRDLFCIYHYWHEGHRVLAIDRMDFAGGGRIFVSGPTSSSQTEPNKPQTFDAEFGRAETGESFLCEITFRRAISAVFRAGDSEVLSLVLDRDSKSIVVRAGDRGHYFQIDLAHDFDFDAARTLRVDADGLAAAISINNTPGVLRMELERAITSMETVPGNDSEILARLLTCGFEETFETDSPERRGWTVDGDCHRAESNGGMLIARGAGDRTCRLSKRAAADRFELAVNLRVAQVFGGNTAISIRCGVWFSLSIAGRPKLLSGEKEFYLPDGFDASTFHQFRFVSDGARTSLWIEGTQLGGLAAAPCESIELEISNAVVELDMVRFTVT